jgi:ABC-type glycerol-3-phosphate transport system permease component
MRAVPVLCLGADVVDGSRFQLRLRTSSRLPGALGEAALMDNASEVRVLYSIMLLLVCPGLAAVAIFTAIQAWNEFLFGLTMTTGGPLACR